MTINVQEHLEEILSRMQQTCPNLLALSYPKSYRVPEGYSHPRLFSMTAYASASSMIMSGDNLDADRTMTACHISSSLLIRYQVPTFFVGAELCEALLETEAPEDLTFSEIHWPMPAMLFMLPKEFSLRYFGAHVPFLTVARAGIGQTIKSPLIISGAHAKDIYQDTGHNVFITTMLRWENGHPMHYDARSPEQHAVKDLINCPCCKHKYTNIALDKTTVEEDQVMVGKLTTLSVNILLAMTAEPELVSPESVIRPERKVSGKILRRALWQPHIIGENFRIHYESHAPTGTHRSPHAHWRCGHWRNQRHGPQNTLMKRIWIRPVFVGLKAEKDSL